MTDLKKEYKLVLLVFFLIVGPGPVLLILNKYTVSFLPAISLILYIFLLKDEIMKTDFNSYLKRKETYIWAFKALQYSIYTHAIGYFIFRPDNIITDDLIQNYLIMPFYVVLVGPIVEEVAYRKILFTYLEQRFNFWAASIITSALFSIGHFSPDRFIVYFVVGLLFCYAYKKSGSILSVILAHASLNFISIVVRTIKGG